jgi:hypothetical protein
MFVFPVGPLFRLRVSHHLDHAPFPHPAHQTGRADFPHPAFGQGLLLSVAKRRKVFNWQSGILEERPDQTRPLSQAADGKMEFQLKFFQV